mgnify:FL=1|jgi:hypothetical protein
MKKKIIETYEHYAENGLTFADGLDAAIIGIEQDTYRIVYSRKKVIKILTKETGNRFEAIEYAEFNIFDVYVGEQTPIWVDDDFL